MNSLFQRLASIPSRTIVLIICLLVLMAGFGYSVYLGDLLRFPDETWYTDLMTSLVDQGIFSMDGEISTASKPPGYVFFLFVLRILGGSIFVFRYVNFIMLALSIYLIYLIARQQSSPFAGVLSAIMLAAYGVLFYTAGTLYPQTFANFLFILILYMLSRVDDLSLIQILILGALFAWLILAVITFLFALGLVALWILIKPGWSFARKLRFLVPVFMVVIVSLGIWSYRNYTLFDRFIFVSTQGDAFLQGNSENTHPNDGPNTDISQYLTPEVRAMDEADRDSYFRSQALDYILNNPVEWFQLYIAKVLNHFNIQNNLYTASESSPLQTLYLALTYIPLLIAFLVRTGLSYKYRPSHFELLMIVLYFAAAFYSALVFTRIRYRLPYDMMIILVVAMFIARFEPAITSFFSRWLSGADHATPRSTAEGEQA